MIPDDSWRLQWRKYHDDTNEDAGTRPKKPVYNNENLQFKKFLQIAIHV